MLYPLRYLELVLVTPPIMPCGYEKPGTNSVFGATTWSDDLRFDMAIIKIPGLASIEYFRGVAFCVY